MPAILVALIPCPECKKQISDTADKCPSCGYIITAEKIAEIKQTKAKSQNKAAMGCLVVVVLIIGFFFVLFLIDEFNLSKKPPREAVYNSESDGSVWEVKLWLKQHLNDPDSVQYIEWSTVRKTKAGNLVVRVKFRAKNSYGAYVIAQKLFVLDRNKTVIEQTDYPG